MTVTFLVRIQSEALYISTISHLWALTSRMTGSQTHMSQGIVHSLQHASSASWLKQSARCITELTFFTLGSIRQQCNPIIMQIRQGLSSVTFETLFQVKLSPEIKHLNRLRVALPGSYIRLLASMIFFGSRKNNCVRPHIS